MCESTFSVRNGTAYFNVLPKRVNTWHNTSISSDTYWDSPNCPYGVNGIVTIESSAVLTIYSGCVVKFNYSSGFLVKGALVALGTTLAPVIFTSYQFSLAGGDWNGIEFEDSVGSVIQYSIVEFGTDAIIANSSSPLIENSVIRNSSRRGISLYDSQATIRNNTITNNSEGMYIYDSTPLVVDNVVEENLAGIRLDSSDNATFKDNLINNNSYGINVTQSTNVSLVSTTFRNSNLRALNVNTASELSVWNSTFESNTIDILLIAAEVSLINCPFNESKLSMTPGSTLYVKNFLHIQIEDPNGTAFLNATVRVMVNGLQNFNGPTDTQGRINWLVLTDRTYEGTNAPVKSQIVVNVSAGSNYNVANNDRTVDMASTHTETFVVSVKGSTNGPPPNGSSLDLVPLLTALAFILCAAIILGFFLLFRRRKSKEEKEVKKKVKEKVKKEKPMEMKKVEKPTEFVAKPVVPVAPVARELKTGTIYLLDEEKPTGAYKILKKELDGGAKGLIVTKTPPKKVREKYSIDCGFIWLTRETSEDSVNPTNLGSILNSAKGFLKGVDNGILVLDGLEYLIVQNQFSKALMFIHLLNESVSTSNSRVLISFNLKSLDDVERALLTSDLEVLS